MTRELKHQRDALVTANEQLTDRRRFIEAVLAGVSAGVVGLDSRSHYAHVARRQRAPRHNRGGHRRQDPSLDVLPEFAPVLEHRRRPGASSRGSPQESPSPSTARRTHVLRSASRARRRTAARRLGGHLRRHLRTRRRSAHLRLGRRRPPHRARDQEPADAHHLSAERIRRKYGRVIRRPRNCSKSLPRPSRHSDRRRRADIRELVAGILEDEGHRRAPRATATGAAAIEARRPHLVFLDIWLQGSRLDGLAAARRIKSSIPTCRW
jgi:two-component system, NtrC family, nitrogen regulation sensor histidine kinase NtrY